MGNNNNPNPSKEAEEEALTELQMRQRVAEMNNINKKSSQISQSFKPGSNNLISVSHDRDSFLRSSQNQELAKKNDKNYAYAVGSPRAPNNIEKLLLSLQFGEESIDQYQYIKYYSNNTPSDAVPALTTTSNESSNMIINNMLPEALFNKNDLGAEITSGNFIRIEFLDVKNNQNAIVVELPGPLGAPLTSMTADGITKQSSLKEVREKFFIGENPKQDIFDRNARKRDLSGITEFIIHETTSFSSIGTSKTLLRKGLGVHYLVSESGALQPTGAWENVLAHAGSSHNQRSIGVEVVAPFYAEYAQTYSKRVGPYWKNVTNYAPWAHVRDGSSIKGYIFPSPSQMECTWALTNIVTSSKKMNIPMKFLGFEKENNRFVISGVKHYSKARGPGIYAHSYFGHSDGAVLVLYCFLRHNKLKPSEAYRACITLLEKGKLKYSANNYYADLNLLGREFNV